MSVNEDIRILKFGGRRVSLDENGVFNTEKQIGSVEICSAAANKIAPEELEQKIEVTETGVNCIQKKIERLELDLYALKLEVSKKIN